MHSQLGMARSTRAANSGEEAAPPIMTRRMLDKFHCEISGALSTALAMVGTRHMSVAWCS